MSFLKNVYLVMLYRACQYINNYLCTACQKHLPPHDTHHVKDAEGCKVTHRYLVYILKVYIVVAIIELVSWLGYLLELRY